MMEIKVLGPGCFKCEELLKHTQQAVSELDLECAVEKVSDIQEITGYGVMMTPALVINGQVKVTGRVPAVAELKTLIANG